jgi:hypothetical protein
MRTQIPQAASALLAAQRCERHLHLETYPALLECAVVKATNCP